MICLLNTLSKLIVGKFHHDPSKNNIFTSQKLNNPTVIPPKELKIRRIVLACHISDISTRLHKTETIRVSYQTQTSRKIPFEITKHTTTNHFRWINIFVGMWNNSDDFDTNLTRVIPTRFPDFVLLLLT